MSDGELPRVQPSVEISQRVQPTGPQRDPSKKKRRHHDPTEDVIEVGDDADEPTGEAPQFDEGSDDDGLDLRV
ncbi:MAG: hypothetical protein AB1725_04455 [Armatimonadota bacterium]